MIPRASELGRRPRRTWGQRVLITLGALTSVGLLLVAGALYWLLDRYQNINFVPVENVEAAAAGEPSNWLLVGSDSREGIDEDDPNADVFVGGNENYSGKRTDTIIVARIDPGTQVVDLLSIPRDLYVPIPGTGGSNRINAAFSTGGAERLVDTVENVLDIEINNYAEVNFVGFRDVVDAVGGVPIYFETPVQDNRSGLFVDDAGCHVLDGNQALAFARSRYLKYQDEDGDWTSDGTSDFGRNSRQQFLLSRLADRASSQIGFADFGTIDAIVRAGGENLLLDDGSGAGDLIDLARSFAGVGGEGVRFHSLNVSDIRNSAGAVLQLNEEASQPALEIFRGILPAPDPTAFPAAEGADRSTFTVQVLNGAGEGGLAGSTSGTLEGLGFQLAEPADAPELIDETTILYSPGSEGAATELGRVLKAAPRFEADPTVDDVTLVLGADFEGVTDVSIAGVTVSTAPAEGEGGPVEDTTENLKGWDGAFGPGPEGTECYFPT
jgi:LCP family protein required for cell wall assembly